jgi:hypothetical protein
LYFKATGRCISRDFVADPWGDFVRYIEVADDQLALRQVDLFENGNVLRYDRQHWCDDFGQLLGLRFSRKPKWVKFFPDAETVEASEFERIWRNAQGSLMWKEQVARSRAECWGAKPHWLREV